MHEQDTQGNCHVKKTRSRLGGSQGGAFLCVCEAYGIKQR